MTGKRIAWQTKRRVQRSLACAGVSPVCPDCGGVRRVVSSCGDGTTDPGRAGEACQYALVHEGQRVDESRSMTGAPVVMSLCQSCARVYLYSAVLLAAVEPEQRINFRHVWALANAALRWTAGVIAAALLVRLFQ